MYTYKSEIFSQNAHIHHKYRIHDLIHLFCNQFNSNERVLTLSIILKLRNNVRLMFAQKLQSNWMKWKCLEIRSIYITVTQQIDRPDKIVVCLRWPLQRFFACFSTIKSMIEQMPKSNYRKKQREKQLLEKLKWTKTNNIHIGFKFNCWRSTLWLFFNKSELYVFPCSQSIWAM